MFLWDFMSSIPKRRAEETAPDWDWESVIGLGSILNWLFPHRLTYSPNPDWISHSSRPQTESDHFSEVCGVPLLAGETGALKNQIPARKIGNSNRIERFDVIDEIGSDLTGQMTVRNSGFRSQSLSVGRTGRKSTHSLQPDMLSKSYVIWHVSLDRALIICRGGVGPVVEYGSFLLNAGLLFCSMRSRPFSWRDATDKVTNRSFLWKYDREYQGFDFWWGLLSGADQSWVGRNFRVTLFVLDRSYCKSWGFI
jgi:hypothetical protein